MRGGAPPITLYAFMSCIETTLPLTLYIKEKGLYSLDCIHLAKDGDKWWAVVCWIHVA
jgi:hypothetical protein